MPSINQKIKVDSNLKGKFKTKIYRPTKNSKQCPKGKNQGKECVNFVDQKVSYKDKLYARKQIRRHLKKLKIIEERDVLKCKVNKVSLPSVETYFENKVCCNSLIDSGSSINLISQPMLNKLIQNGVVSKVLTSNIECFSAGNTALNIKGRCFAKISIGRFCWKIQMYIASELSWEVILGCQFVRESQMILDLSENHVYFKFKPTVKIPLKMKVCNYVNNVECEEIIGSPEVRRELEELMSQYNNVFTDKIGKAINVQCDIKLKDEVVVNLKPYPINPPKMLRTKAILDKLLEEDIIEPSVSDFSSPSFIVNTTGKDRLVINYSVLNSHIIRTAHPIGDLQDCVHFMTGARYFSTIDLSNSFYQIELTPESRKYTAFSTGYSLYNFKRLPFGLNLGSGLLSSLLDNIFHDLKFVKVINFIDDIICYTEDLESHMDLLKIVFERLSQHGLTVNPKKVRLAYKSISYLGNIISHNKITIDPSRVEKVINFPRPKNAKELSRFIGMTSYFARSIPNYAEIACCLNDLRRKRVKFDWSSKCEDSFSKLKLALSNPPVLKLADFNKEFILQCDSSQKAIGVCLLQEDDDNNRLPVAYYSKKFTPAEYVLDIYQKESLAIVYGIEKFHKFLEIKPFQLETDNEALSYLLKRGNKLGKLARWAHKIFSLPFTVKHVKSNLNPIADSLSRMYSEDEIELPPISIENCTRNMLDAKGNKVYVNIESNNLVNKVENREEVNLLSNCPLGFVELKELQNSDPEIVKIKESVLNKTNKGNFYIKNEVLLYKKSEKSCSKIYIPESLIKVLFEFYHVGSYGSHYGQFKTVHKICSKYYRPGLNKEVRELVQRCEKCKEAKPARHYHGPLRTVPASGVWETIFIDIMGPLVRSNGYNNVLILVDAVSKYCHLIPLINATAQTVINKLKDVFKMHGVCSKIVSDGGSCFKAHQFKNFMFKLGIEHHIIPAYMQKINSAERYLQSLKNQLIVYFQSDQKGWFQELWYLQMAVNTSINESTKFTSHELMFSYMPKDALSNRWKVNELLELNTKEPKVIQSKIQEALENIKLSIKKNQKRKLYSEEMAKHPFKIGDIVYLQNHGTSDKSKNIQGKMLPRYVGKWKIILIENVVSCVIQQCENELLCKRVHISQLKK